VARRADPVTQYARGVLAGKSPAGHLARLACKRHLADLKTAKRRGLVFDVEAAVRDIGFFNQLCHYKGEWAGKPLVLSPWQAFIIGSLFGWKRAGDGLRRFREAYEEVPRKNGKSTKDAGLGIRLAFFDGEQGAEVYCAATKKDQARIIFGDAKQMVLRTPALRKRLRVFTNNLSSEALASKLEPLGADEDTLDGLNIHGALIDEVHAHKTSGVVDVLKTATGARRQPLIKYVTTAGFDRTSICWKLRDYAVKVLEGTVQDDSFFAYIACADPKDDYRDRRTWAKANPNLGVSVSESDLARKAKQAEHMPAALNAFLRLHLNIWTEQSERAIDMELWDKGNAPVRVEPGAECVAGLDMASTTDLCAEVKLFGPDKEGAFDVIPRFWMPAASIEAGRSKRTEELRRLLEEWAQQGFITTTSGNVTDYDQVEREILDGAEDYRIRELAFDGWNVTQLVTHLQDEWGEGDTATVRLVEFGQGFKDMSPPTKELLRLLADGKLRHGGNPVLRWMASNLALRQDPAGNMKPDRVASGDKIDGIVALVMALGCAILARQKAPSFYEERAAENRGRPEGDRQELIDSW
jgi:phage terminase large subunit-like protein